jgi:hypothetical protein
LTSEDGGTNAFERVDEPPEPPAEGAFLGTPWDRRTFLKAAALGTAAAAIWQKGPGLTFGPAAAYANDLSESPCTANDVVVVGTGLVVNEPCTCTGTFPATVQFQLQNNTNTNRYCVALHFPVGSPFGEQDVILHTTPTGSDSTLPPGEHTMYGTILGFPCNTGGTLICVGPFDANGNPTVVRGKCAPGTCATIAWSTSPNNAGCTTADPTPPGGQCRHQGICIQGFGISATCADASCAERSLTDGCCSVPCNGTLSVKIVASGQTGTQCNTPLTISVQRPGEAGFTNVTLTGSGCYVDPSPLAGTYTFRATDCHGCFRQTTLQVCVQQLATPHIIVGPPDCSGIVTVTIDQGCPQTGVTFTLQTSSACDGTFTDSAAVFTNCATTIQLAQGQTTCLRVKASNGNAACDQLSNCVCVAVPAALTIGAPVQSDNPCSGVVMFTATPSGGVGPYTLAWSLDGGAPVSGATFTYHPTLVNGALDTSCHSLVVTVTDANGCTATSPATTFSQCASTATGCTP